MVNVDPKLAASATKVVVGVALVTAGTVLQKKGLKELGGKFLQKSTKA